MKDLQKPTQPDLTDSLPLADGFIDPRVELPSKKSDRNNNFSAPLLLLIGKRKYKGSYSFHFGWFYKDGFHTENYIFDISQVSGWKYR